VADDYRRADGDCGGICGAFSVVAGFITVKAFQDLWKRAAVISLVFGGALTVVAWITGSPVLWGLATGIAPGEVDLVGLGLRLPLFAQLNPRAAVTGVNLRFLSRLLVLGVYFYVLHRYTTISLYSAIIGIFVPHAVYLVLAARASRGKGVKE
jgi:multisubunit Na+/H+ antiporter MnhG subunit